MDNETTTGGARQSEAHEPFPRSGLGALLFAAATDSPDAIFLGDDDGDITAGEIAARARLIAASLRKAGIAAGERVLIVAGAQTAAVVALAAALGAGLEPALVPIGLGPVELAAHARAASATALVGPSGYSSLAPGDAYLSAAALVDTIRVVATQGPEAVDGAMDLSTKALAGLALEHTDSDDTASESPIILTFEGPASAPTLVAQRQATLFADALSLVEQARINPSKRIISTLPPATAAGLVAGPYAALVGAAGLVLHGPFDARRFLAACDKGPGHHVVAPCVLGPAFEERRLSAQLGSLILVSRFADAPDFALPATLDCDRPMVDLYAFGEETLLARRRTDGEARPPARVTDTSVGGGLGARLNRARADQELRLSERS